MVITVIVQEMVRILDSGYKAAGNKGEFLTKRCLDFWIQSDEYEDKARPEFLRNPSTSKLLPTEVYSSENAVGDIKARDLIKECLGRHNGIIMVTVTAPDLEPALFDRLVPTNCHRVSCSLTAYTDGINETLQILQGKDPWPEWEY